MAPSVVPVEREKWQRYIRRLGDSVDDENVAMTATAVDVVVIAVVQWESPDQSHRPLSMMMMMVVVVDVIVVVAIAAE